MQNGSTHSGKNMEKSTIFHTFIQIFKKKGGYHRSIELSREYGLYRQDYCGCVYSKEEAVKRNEGRAN